MSAYMTLGRYYAGEDSVEGIPDKILIGLGPEVQQNDILRFTEDAEIGRLIF